MTAPLFNYASNGAGEGNNWLSGQDSITWGHVVSVGTDASIYVGTMTYSGSLVTVTGITCDGVAMSKIDDCSSNLEGNFQGTEVWQLDGVSAGTLTIAVELSGTADVCTAFAISVSGKNSTGVHAFGHAQALSAVSVAPDVNLSVTADDCMVLSFVHSRGSGPITARSGYSTTVENGNIVGHCVSDSGATAVTPGTFTLGFDLPSSVTVPGVISFAISATSGMAMGAVDLSDPDLHVLTNNTNSIWAEEDVVLKFLDADSGELTVKKTGLSTDAAGLVGVVTDAALVDGTEYDIIFEVVSSGAKGLLTATAEAAP